MINDDLNKIIIILSSEKADKIIRKLKKEIDKYYDNNIEIFNLEFDDNDLLDLDKKMIMSEITKYVKQKYNSKSLID